MSTLVAPALLPQHGLGGAQDLPISRELAILGAAAAVAISFVVLALAWRTAAVRRGHQRPAGSRLARGVRRLGLVARPAPPGRPARTDLPGRRRGVRQGPPDQPDLRHLLRLDLGRRPGRVAALRARLEGDQPVPPDQYRHRPRLGRRPRRRRLHLPRAAGAVAGRARPVRVRLDGARLHPQRRPVAGPAVVRGLPRADDHRWRAVREHVLRPGRPVRGLLLARRPGVDLGPSRRGAGAPQPPGQPGHHAGDPRADRRGRGALRQYGVRRVPRLDPVADVHPGQRDVDVPAEQPRPARLLPRRRRDLLGRLHLHRRRAGAVATPAAQPVRVLPDPDRGRLHRRPLPELLRRGRDPDTGPGERPAEQRQQHPRHRRTRRALLAVVPPDVPGEHEGAWPSSPVTSSGSSPPTSGRSSCCRRSTSSPASCPSWRR